MPKDTRGAPVEYYRLTDRQKTFMDKIQRFQKIRQGLEVLTTQKQKEFQNLQEMWKALGKGMEMIRLDAPQEMVKEIPGMDFGEEDSKNESASMEQPGLGEVADQSIQW